MKRLITSMLIVLLISVAFIGSFYKGYYSYAEDINYMSDAELEAAYQAYLQSRGGSLIGNAGARLAYTNGKMLNFLTSEYNTTPFKNINQVKGLLAWEKSELESGNTSVLQLTMRHPEVFSLYTQWLLQNHYFGNDVSEESNGFLNNNVDNTVYSGELYTIDNGSSCLVYRVQLSSDGANVSHANKSKSLIKAYGSKLQYNGADITSFINVGEYYNAEFTINGNIYKGNKTSAKSYSNGLGVGYFNSPAEAYYNWSNDNILSYYDAYHPDYSRFNSINGEFTIVHFLNDNSYAVGFIGINNGNSRYLDVNSFEFHGLRISDNTDTSTSVDINFYTNNIIQNDFNITDYPDIDADGTLYITPKVKVGVDYQPYTVNEGDTITNVVNNYYNDSGEKDKTVTVPSTTPDSGSGGSGGGNNPSGGTPPNWSNPYPNLSPDGNGGFNFNFNLPDLNIDWNISGLSEKFPFSIPFDLISFVSILNTEPETPHFEGTVNLIVYEWNIDADLSQFDNLASIVRNVEFIGFCITLILITRKMIKG